VKGASAGYDPCMGLRILAVLKAARDFGLEPASAAALANRTRSFDELVDAIADELIRSGAVALPDALV
jgi:predicted Zn-dependent protease